MEYEIRETPARPGQARPGSGTYKLEVRVEGRWKHFERLRRYQSRGGSQEVAGKARAYSWQGTWLFCPQGRSVEEQCPREVPGGEGRGGSWGNPGHLSLVRVSRAPEESVKELSGLTAQKDCGWAVRPLRMP